MLMLVITRGNHFRSVWTAGHSRFWQSGRPFHCVIQLCQQLGFVSGQSECPAGYAKYPQQIRPAPEGRRTPAACMLQPFPTVVFAAVSPDGEFPSLCGIDTKQPIS